MTSSVFAATPPGTVINNSATAAYTEGGSGPYIVTSNTASVTVGVQRTSSVLELLQYGAGSPGAQPVPVAVTAYSQSSTTAGPFAPLAPPVHIAPGTGGTPIDLTNPVPLVPAAEYHAGEPIFIRLTDIDQNMNPAALETVLVTMLNSTTGDRELLRLTETGPNTGIFTGYLQTGPGPAAAGNGVLSVVNGSSISASYSDVQDAADARAASVMVDPFGLVFSSATGLPVNGAAVTLLNAATGLPATVYGDDGVSSFPASVTTGGTAVDSSGRTYTFSAGGYRFPYIAPGRYRLVVTPPADHRAPSAVSTAALQTLPGAPFAIVDPGSRGEEFLVNPGPAIHIDIPVDPTGTGLWLIKTAGKLSAAAGDMVPYRLSLENTSSTASAFGVSVTDRLPNGFRYRKGSARVNGAGTGDPSVSADGRSITFSLGDLAPVTTTDIVYVAEIGAGARPGAAVNTAAASGSFGSSSNTASATVNVIEDLFRSKATIMGRIAADGCGDAARSDQSDLSGIRLFLEDGTYVVTDRNGMYHFEAVNPGTHVVQIDAFTVPERYELLLCEENSRFAGTAFSQFVDLQGGALWRADFHLGLRPKTIGTVGVEIGTSVKRSGPDGPVKAENGLVEYTVNIHVTGVPTRNLTLAVMLPEDAVYIRGSSAMSGRPVEDPKVSGSTVSYRLNAVPAGWDGTLLFAVDVPVEGAPGDLPAQAVLTVDTPSSRNRTTPVVATAVTRGTREVLRSAPDIVLRPRFESGSTDLAKQDREELDRLIAGLKNVRVKHITVTGHTDSQGLGARLQKSFPDNYALSRARAVSVGTYIAEALALGPEQISYDGKGPDLPVASNETEEGRSLNRRVELKVETLQVVAVPVLLDAGQNGDKKSIATLGLRPGEAWEPEPETGDAAPAVREAMPDFDAPWIESAAPGFELLWPREGHAPSVPTLRAAVKHDAGRSVKIFVNGAEADAIYFDGTLTRKDNTTAVSTWRGLSLVEGDNRIEAVEYDNFGVESARIKRVIHYAGPPVRAALVESRSQLVADGRNPVVITVKLLDKDGYPAREGMLGEFSADPPHLPMQRVQGLQESPLIAQATDRYRYQVGEQGLARIELRPTSQAGEAVVRLALAGGSHELRVWVKPEDRDWVLVGLAEGTAGYNMVTGNMETLSSAGQDERLYDDGRLAFYAKGMIKGEWLLTLAYDSDKSTGGQQSMYQTVDPNKYYLLYGDGTEQLYDAASAKHVYVRLERGQFYALFGDFATGLTVTEFSRYSRNLTGFKSEMKSDRFEYNVFVADTDQAHVKDEIQGDGTSGLYRLSRRNIVINSESVVIEARDRFRSEVIVSRQMLTRHLDYTIDYNDGTIYFKSPVASRDANFNPLYIVAEYETFDPSDTAYAYGGRAAVKSPDQRVQIGVSHAHEGPRGAEGDLTGLDATVQAGPSTKVRAEVATTRTNRSGAVTEGSAYLAEVQHRSPSLDGTVYVREQEPGFGLGQQNGGETGMRKYGGDLSYRFGSPWYLGVEAFRQENLSTGAVRDMAELRGRYVMPGYEIFTGLRHVEDTLGTGDSYRSQQLFGGLKYQFTDRLTARVQHDQTLNQSDNSVDYPTRTTIGADYRLNRSATLFADQEFTRGAQADTAMSRVGMRASPWTGGQLNSTMERQTTENGSRLFATTGLKQSWQATQHWSFDAGLDRSATIHKSGEYQINPNVPPASGGTEDFTAAFLGAGYREATWSWTGRIEQRWAETEDKISFFTGANGVVRDGLALAAGLQTFRTTGATGLSTFNGDLRVGAVYRPAVTRYIVLERFDVIRSEQHGAPPSYDNWRLVNNFVLNYKLENRMQWSFQYGSKFVTETIEQNDYRGYTDLTGIEGRYDFTRTWDAGVRVSVLRSWAIGQADYGTSASVGMHAARNLWVSMGYNFTGFTDRDFSKADFTAQGPFIKLRLKFDQVSVREAVKWITGQ